MFTVAYVLFCYIYLDLVGLNPIVISMKRYNLGERRLAVLTYRSLLPNIYPTVHRFMDQYFILQLAVTTNSYRSIFYLIRLYPCSV